MSDADQHPDFRRWAAAQRPDLRRHGHAAARIEHAALHDELASVDAQLAVLSARRRRALAGLHRLRPRLWPSSTARHGRRPARVDEPAMPPVPEGAHVVGGTELRTVCVGILRRHGGALALRELHGLLHRHGYEVAGPRPVQRLADALAYEVSQGRCNRVERGVYTAVAAEEPARRRGPVPSLAVEPLPWRDPDADEPQIDPIVVDDPERWSDGRWPRAADAGHPTGPAGRFPPSRLDEEVRLAQERCAALVQRRLDEHGPSPQPTAPPVADAPPDPPAPPTPADPPDPSEPPNPPDPAASTDPADPADAPWERFVDESDPMVRQWARLRREWAARKAARAEEAAQRRAVGPDWPDLVGGPGDAGDPGDPDDEWDDGWSPGGG